MIAPNRQAAGGRVHQDPARHKAFVNTKLGIAWAGKLAGDAGAAKLAERTEDFGLDADGKTAVAVAGAGFQDKWRVAQIVGFRVGGEAWSLGYHCLHGDPSEAGFWDSEDHPSGVSHRPPGGRTIPVAAACLDSRGLLAAKGLEFRATRHQRRICEIKGAAKQGTPPWPRKPGYPAEGRWPPCRAGVDGLKEQQGARLPEAGPGEGTLRFPADRERTYFEAMAAENPRSLHEQQAGRERLRSLDFQPCRKRHSGEKRRPVRRCRQTHRPSVAGVDP